MYELSNKSVGGIHFQASVGVSGTVASNQLKSRICYAVVPGNGQLSGELAL